MFASSPERPVASISNWYAGGYSYDTTYSWGGANNFKDFATTGSGRCSYLSYISYMSTADLLGYDYGHDGAIDHWQMVSGFNSGYSPYTQLMTQHTGGYFNKPLSEILTAGSSASNAWHSAMRT
ncbi:amidase domain-containing protein [Pedococcus sp. NPDC057267]|uniref:amidase domain-containing protein n=1 Tax=Pedococcus sp. NPDC057267 TaxID=3346077 RepID=UPI00362A2FEF